MKHGLRHVTVLSALFLGVTLFVLLAVLFIVGAIDRTLTNPGLFCSIVRLAFDDRPGRSPAAVITNTRVKNGVCKNR